MVLACCGTPTRMLELVPSLSGCASSSAINSVRVSALGDFPPTAANVTATRPGQAVSLSIPPGTQVITVEGVGQGNVVLLLGRTAPLQLSAVAGARLPIAYGAPDALCPTAALNIARTGHHATLLPSGNVVITGGADADGYAVTALELYLPTANPASFRPVDGVGLSDRRALGHAVVVLPDGGFVVTGGAPPSGFASEIYTRHRADGTFAGPELGLGGGPRALHTATLLRDGRILLTGGCAVVGRGSCQPGAVLATAMLLDPATGRFTGAPPLLHARYGHEAVLRGDGSLLILGGRGEQGPVPAGELYFVDAPAIDLGPLDGRAAALDTGSVLLAGGAETPAAAVNLWTGPAEPPYSSLSALPSPRSGHTATVLEDGSVLVAGGANNLLPATSLVLYDGRGTPRTLAPSFIGRGHTATRLADGTVLLTGGIGAAGIVTGEASVYFRSLIGPFSNFPALNFGAGEYLPRRPDRALSQQGLRITAARGDGSRPAEFMLLPGMRIHDFDLSLLAGRIGDGALALIFGYRSDSEYAFVSIPPGRPAALAAVGPPMVGQTAVLTTLCQGALVADGDLADAQLGDIKLSFRGGAVTLQLRARQVLRCAPAPAIARGAFGVGALSGSVTVTNLQITR